VPQSILLAPASGLRSDRGGGPPGVGARH